MRFCDKLPKLRKNNNYSQEQLADKLGVSRQAVSKWELGSSYPDMDKIIQMCNILNCTLDEIMDDGVIGEEKNINNKNNFYHYLDDFLDFITKIINMFGSMKFKEKIKCFFEMVFLGFIIFILGLIIFSTLDYLTNNLLNLFPEALYPYFNNLFETIYLLALIVLGFIVFIHLFKIRYLDYFITIEDKNVKEKIIEKSLDCNDKNIIKESQKEKIIIRDPKHSTQGFIHFIGKILLFIIKCFALIIGVPCLVFFMALVIFLIILICYIYYSSIFLYLAIAIAGLLLINFVVIELIYKFITNLKQKAFKIFVLSLISFGLIGIGAGLFFVRFTKFDMIEDNNYKFITDIKYLDFTDNMILHGLNSYDNIEYIIDNNIDNIKIEISHIDGIKINIKKLIMQNDKEYDYYYVDSSENFNKLYKLILDDIKDNKINNYNSSKFVKTKVYVNQNNYNKLLNNADKLND